MNKQLPIYDIELNDDCAGMTCVSLVDEPAIETDFMIFSKEHENILFSDYEKHEIFGPAIIAGMPIYRCQDGREFYVRFTSETIKKIVERFSQDKNFNVVSLQHNGQNIDNVILTEMFIKDDNNGISPLGFENISNGSLFMRYKIYDDELWEQIKNSGKINGFSIEIECDFTPIHEDFSQKNDDDAKIDAFVEELLS